MKASRSRRGGGLRTSRSSPSRRLRILWSSNSVTVSSGYGTQSRGILYRMLDAGYPTAEVAFSDIEGGIFELDGLRIYPRLMDPLGEDACIAHGDDWGADVTFTFQDIWVLDATKLARYRRWVPWIPVDSDPLKAGDAQRLPLAYEILTHSRFGQRLLEKNGFSSTYLPQSVDTKVFVPHDRTQARRRFGLPPDVFLFGMVAANLDNPSRKGIQEALDAFQVFRKRHSKSALFLHTSASDSRRGFPIAEYATYLGLSDAVYGLPAYTAVLKLDETEIAWLYSSFDCLLSPSTFESFCRPIVEAQACGVPVIVNNTTSMPELVGAGAVCETGWAWWTSRGSYARHADVGSLVQKMEEIYAADRGALAAKARQFVVSNYDTDRVFRDGWLPYLKRLERRIRRGR